MAYLAMDSVFKKTRKPPKIIALGFLLVAGLLASCKQEPKNTGQNDSSFKVIDSKVWAATQHTSRTAWFDDETVLFTGHSKIKTSNGFQKRAIMAWNINTGVFSTIVDENSGSFCFDNGVLTFSESGFHRYFAELTRVGDEVLIKKKVAASKQSKYMHGTPHCTQEIFTGTYDRTYIADLQRFNGELRKVWYEQRPLTDVEMRNPETKFSVIFYTENNNERKVLELPLMKQPYGVRYMQHLDQYYFYLSEGGATPRFHPLRHFLLNKHAEVGELEINPIWGQSPVYITKSGVVVSDADMRIEQRKPSDNGAFLITGPKVGDVTELLHGYVRAISVSPDGCKLAVTHFIEYIMARKQGSSLKIIDLCVDRSDK